MSSCKTPLQNKQTREFFPCGKCYDCKSRRISGWSYRLMNERKTSSSSYFITFTYDNDHVPLTANGFPTLEKRSFQLFMKRLRKLNPKSPIKYYMAGEYGGQSKRPHYHAIMYNVNLVDLCGESIARQIAMKNIPLDGKYNVPCPLWGKGHITLGELTEASCSYTLKYITKPKTIPIHARDDREPEFSLMSKGLGKSYLTDEMKLWHKSKLTERMYHVLPSGGKISMCRYYKEKIYSKWQRLQIAHAMQLLTNVDKTPEEISQEHYDLCRKSEILQADQRRSLTI